VRSSSFDYFKLGLGANPLRCDCDVRWLYSLMHSTDSFRLSGLPWTCDDGRRFAQLSDQDFSACQQLQQANCSTVTPPPDVAEPDQPGNSTETGKLSLVLQVVLFVLQN